MDNTVRETGTAPHKAAQDLTTGDFLAAGQLTTGKLTEIMHVQTYPHMRGQETVILHRPIGQTNVLSSTADAEHRFQIATDAEVQAARETTRRYEEIANIHAFADWLKANPSLPISYLRMQVSPGQNVLPHLDVWDSGAEGLAELKRLAEIMGAPLEDGDDRTQAIKTFGPVEYRVIAWHKGPAEPMPAPDSDPTGPAYTRAADGDSTDGLTLTAQAHEVLAVAPVSPARAALQLLAAHGGPDFLHDEDGT